MASLTKIAALRYPQIGKALTAVHADFGRNLSPETLAREDGMSRSAFSGKFRALVGITPVKYLTG